MALRKVIELEDTISTGVAGDADTVYRMLPRIWLKNIIDAAKKQHYATQFAYQTELQKGQHSVVIPKRRKYYGSGSEWQDSAGEGGGVNYTKLGNLSGVAIQPADSNYGISISNKLIRTHALDIIRHAREELTYACGDAVDWSVFAALKADGNKAAATLIGSQAIYGGDATRASELASNDVFTTDHIATANRLLKSTICTYWTYGTGTGTSSESKNPWANETNAPFVLFIAPEQEEKLLTDSQFVNASEYGSDKVIHTGEIGEYLRIKVIVTPNTPAYAANTTHPDATTAAVAQHRCIMMKAQKAVAVAWGQKPKLYVVDFASELEKRLVIEQAYKAEQVHSDAIVHINVADE